MAVVKNEPMVGASEPRRIEDRVPDLEYLLGRETTEATIQKEAPAGSGAERTDVAAAAAAGGRFRVGRVADAMGVSRSQFRVRAAGTPEPRGPRRKAGDDERLPIPSRRLAAERSSPITTHL